MAELTFAVRGQHEGVDSEGQWFKHLYPVDDDQCWCGWKPETVVTVTAAQYGVMNPDGSWTVEEWKRTDDD